MKQLKSLCLSLKSVVYCLLNVGLGRDARLCPLTPADCCLSKCQYSLQKTDLRQSELGLLRGEEHCGLHRPGGDGADVGRQVRDRARPIDMEMPGYQLRTQTSSWPRSRAQSSQKNTEKSGEIKFLSRIIVKAAAVEFCKFEFRFKYFDQIAKSFKVKYSNLVFWSGLCPATPRCPSVTRRRTRRSTGLSLARAEERTEARP